MEEYTMTTKEYLEKKEQEEIDKVFDEAIKEAHDRHMKELKAKEHEEYIQKLITHIADYESELNILIDLHSEKSKREDIFQDDLKTLETDIFNMKVRLTKARNELDRLIVGERSLLCSAD